MTVLIFKSADKKAGRVTKKGRVAFAMPWVAWPSTLSDLHPDPEIRPERFKV